MIAENRRGHANLAGNDHVEQSSPRDVMDDGILRFEFLDVFVALEFQHRTHDGHTGVAAREPDLVLEFGPQQPFIVLRR